MKYVAHAAIGLAFLLVTVQLTFSQDGAPQPCPEPCPDMTAGTLGCELIEWSHLQEPVPLPNPDTNSAPAPDEQSAQSANFQRSRTSAQNNSGVATPGEKYVLADDNTTYQPNDANAAGHIRIGK
jgi:hypothetical protein